MRAERIEKLERANKRLKGWRRAIAAGEAAGPAIGALVAIMSDPAVSIPKRIQAAEGLLAYKSPQGRSIYYRVGRDGRSGALDVLRHRHDPRSDH